MNQHIYLRAYMAGIVVPTIFLLVVVTVFTIARYVYNIPVPMERVIVFPMAVVPNAWGLWNVLFVALRSRLQLPIGLHGALLPILLAPLLPPGAESAVLIEYGRKYVDQATNTNRTTRRTAGDRTRTFNSIYWHAL